MKSRFFSGKKIFLISAFAIIGLSNIANAQWQQTSLSNTFVDAFAIKGDTIFAGTYGDGVYLSSNNGISWSAVNTGLTNLFVNALAIKGDTIFAGTDGGIFMSSNNGQLWAAVSSSTTVYALAISGNNIFAGTIGSGVYLSSNNGQLWTAVNSGLTDLNVEALAIKGDTIFAGTGGGVFMSSNNGQLWTAVNSGLTDLNVQTLAISGNNIFVGTWSGGVYLSSNNGNSWTPMNTGIINADVHAFAISGSNIFAGTDGGGVFLSSNNGGLWTAVNTGLTNFVVWSLAINGDTLFAGTFNGGVWKRPLSELSVFSISQTNVSCYGGNNGTATVDSVNGGTPPYTYLWNTTPAQTTQTATGLAAENYIITITDANGASSTVSIIITQPSALNIYTSSNTNICKGDTTTICISATGGVPPYQYLWDNSSASSCQTVSPVSTTNYSVTVSDSCTTTSSTLITVTVDTAAKPVITKSGNMLFSTAALYYQWNLNDTLIDGAIGQFYAPLVSGVYSITIIAANGCYATSDTILVVVPSGINELSNSLNTFVYPNPANEILNIYSSAKIAGIKLFNVYGQLVLSSRINSANTAINTGNLADGIYYLQIETKDGIITKNVTISK
jgi:hypothetical protein